ncbi:holo-ACP synthase [Deinococcus caeni]|uniref:holo-ACP synthase n=1 Tax=Deinococcus caeni TaxID=569127 RepID=UPI00361E8EAF
MTEVNEREADLLRVGRWLQSWSAQLSSEVCGIGVDLEEVVRWEGPLRLEALFTPAERRYCEGKARPARHYAGLWCAKEAAFKALSGKITVNLRELEVVHTADGAPKIKFLTPVGNVKPLQLHISITHTSTLAAAVALYTHQL